MGLSFRKSINFQKSHLMSDRVNKAKKAKGAKRAVEIFTRIRSVNFRSNRNIMILGDKSIK